MACEVRISDPGRTPPGNELIEVQRLLRHRRRIADLVQLGVDVVDLKGQVADSGEFGARSRRLRQRVGSLG